VHTVQAGRGNTYIMQSNYVLSSQSVCVCGQDKMASQLVSLG